MVFGCFHHGNLNSRGMRSKLDRYSAASHSQLILTVFDKKGGTRGGLGLLFGLLIIWVEDTVETKRETEQGPQPGHVLRDESRGVSPLMDLEHGDSP